MLAYELFLNNKNSKSVPVKKVQLIKKIFYVDKKIMVDEKTLEEYGGMSKPGSDAQMQEALHMPLNTISAEELNLPDFRTGAASFSPYISVYAMVKEAVMKLRMNNLKKSNSNSITHELDIQENKITKKVDGEPSLRLDREKYLIGSDGLFFRYVDSGIIDKDGALNLTVYDLIINEFFKYVKKQEFEGITDKGQSSFLIFILPGKDIIKYIDQENTKDEPTDEFIDYFGNNASMYSARTTKNTKFLTYDDPAFTINCKQKNNFYKNIGIGKESLSKIYVPSTNKFTISNLEWVFTDILDPDYRFEETRQGFLSQIYKNYQNIKRDKGIRKQVQMKIMCMQISQAKQEILVEENLTMNRMNGLFGTMENVPALCFEMFIDNSGNKLIWNTYVYIIKNFLTQTKIHRDHLLALFNKILRREIYGWIKKKPGQLKPQNFFTKSEFCLKHLSAPTTVDSYMSENEKYAECIGAIARTYIDFKQRNKEHDNSLTDMLTYSKYDRERLRFIAARIGRGIHLSKIAEHEKDTVTNKVSSLHPDTEISDDASTKDYSYFFFKGYYNDMEAKA